jgi:hypothetical protein
MPADLTDETFACQVLQKKIITSIQDNISESIPWAPIEDYGGRFIS